jgi:4-hydroxy-tetrahydrodipicolinate synthase
VTISHTDTKPIFEGIFCPSITITKDDGSIDYDLWGKHLDHLIGAGIDGVLLFGSIGEFYAFPLAVKSQVVQFAVNHIAGRIKVFAGIGGTDTDEVLEFAHIAQSCGVDALVVVSPYYFGPSDATAQQYFGMVARSTDLPIILYNFPPRTGSDLSPELVSELASTYPNIVGIKDTVDTISHTRKVIAAVRKVNPRFSVFSGFDEYYLVNRVSGGNGVLCGMTNVEPETFVAMHEAYQTGDYVTAISCAERISHLMALYDVADLFISAIKGAVHVKGLPISTSIREPAVQLTDAQMTRISTILEQ